MSRDAESIFNAAPNMANQEREGYLTGACIDDVALLERSAAPTL